MQKLQFDYVIVGGGSAGCVLANRLSKNPSVRVALVEAGGEHDTMLINMPLGCGKAINMPKFSWQFKGALEAQSNNRSFFHPRGKVLGGSSSINGLIYIRGQQQDFDEWRDSGATGWGWDDVLPYFKKSEDQQHGENEYHGAGGPLRVEDIVHTHPIEETLMQSARNIGFESNADFNGAAQSGVGRFQTTMKNGQRWSSANAYLDPIRGRKNLTVFTNTLAEKIHFDAQSATGIQANRSGEQIDIHAAREVILSAGSLQSPQLLQLSGVGPGALLQQHGIEVIVDAVNVGENLHDHIGVPMAWHMKNKHDSMNHHLSPLGAVFQTLKYMLNKRGMMTVPAASIGLFDDSSGNNGRPDLQFHCLPLSGDIAIDRAETTLDKFPGMTIMPYGTRPKSRGSLRINSAVMTDQPDILLNYFSHPDDIKVQVIGMQIAEKIMATEPIASLVEKRHTPGPEIDDEAALEDFARKFGHTGYHPVGSCRMGSDADAVVDCELKVRGVTNLRVVDASVMPSIVSGNTNAGTIMIAEKIADSMVANN